MNPVWLIASLSAALLVAAADSPTSLPPREALKPLNNLIGAWKGTGQPEGKRQDFWTEGLDWSWHFTKDDAWLVVAFDKGKYFTTGELHALPEKGQFRLTLKTVGKEEWTFEGSLKGNVLSLERQDAASRETQRLVFDFLHDNRFVYRMEKRQAGQTSFTKVYRVGVTKKDGSFAAGDAKPECIVTGGLGTITVQYKGQTYYVCCSGCRDAFKEDPEKFLKEFNERKAKNK
jgi:hypothetical protein